MKLQFDKNLEYQLQAIASIVDLFRGQTPMQTNFTVSAYKEGLAWLTLEMVLAIGLNLTTTYTHPPLTPFRGGKFFDNQHVTACLARSSLHVWSDRLRAELTCCEPTSTRAASSTGTMMSAHLYGRFQEKDWTAPLSSTVTPRISVSSGLAVRVARTMQTACPSFTFQRHTKTASRA